MWISFTLSRFLATGDSFKTIHFSYRVGISTVCEIVQEVSEQIWKCLVAEYMPTPNDESWKNTANEFMQKWNFPNCIGALDGKHVVIQAPANSGSLFYNYKGTFSIVLLALVDADYKFIAVDIGAYGRNSDAGIYADSNLGRKLEEGSMGIPPPAELPGAPELGKLPHVIVADEAFPLKPFLMRPFPGRHLPEDRKIFNYRLSRARRIVENAFGILSSKWQIYQRRIRLHPDNATAVVKATCVLHNFWRATKPTDGQPTEENEIISECLRNIPRIGNRPAAEAFRVRDAFKEYFASAAGALSYQRNYVRRGLDIAEENQNVDPIL